jgi:hypothetical protein
LRNNFIFHLLQTTDITEHALETFSKSSVKEVCLIGRRGPLQVSFTTKELRELLNMKDCCTIWRPEDMEGIPEIVPQLVKPRKRLTELMVEKFQTRRTSEDAEKTTENDFPSIASRIRWSGESRVRQTDHQQVGRRRFVEQESCSD